MILGTFSRWQSLLIVGILAAIITGVWCGIIAPAPLAPHAFQFELNTPVEIRTRLYYSRGAGWRESESVNELIQRTEQFIPVRLPLLRGKYRGFRFAPTDRAATVQFRDTRITTFDGRTVRRFSSADFTANEAVVRLEERGGVTSLEAGAGGELAQLSVDFEPILRLGFGFWSNVFLHAPRVFKIFVFTTLSLILFEMLWRARDRLRSRIVDFCVRRPRSGLALCALVAAIAASYPVVFLGKSYVSPNYGAVLLYDSAPTLPGYTDLRRDDALGADIGAMSWQHLPYTVRQHRALAKGELPLWNRYSSAGVTLIGQGQSMFGDPLHLLVIAAGGEAWAFDLKFVVAKALFAFGLGLCVWTLTRDFSAAAILTFAGAFIAYFNYRISHPAIFTLCYSPWILAAWFELIFAADRRAFRGALALWFLANWMVLTSGTVKEAYLLFASLNFTGAFAFLLSRRAPREKFVQALFISLAGVAFVLVSSPLWWSFLHALATSKTTYEEPRVVQIQGGWLVGLFDDLFYRNVIPDHHVYQPSSNFLFWVGSVLALMRALRLLAEPGVIAVAITALAAIALAFQLGPHPYIGWVWKIPLLRNVHNFSTIFSCVALVHLGVLAGWGFSVARRPLAAGQAGRCTLVVTAVWLLLMVPYFVSEPPGWARGHVWHGWSELTVYQAVAYSHIVILPLAAWVLMRIASRRLRKIPLGRTEIGMVVIAVGLILVRHGQHPPFAEPNALLTTPGTRADLFRPSPAIEFLQRATDVEPGRVIGTNANLFPGFATVYDLEGINGPNALDNRHYRELSEAAGIATPGIWRYELRSVDVPKWRPMLDFLNVRYLTTAPDELSDPSGFQRAGRFDLEIHRNESAWPRAFFTDQLERYATAADLVRRIVENGTRAPFAALQEGDPVPSLPELPGEAIQSAKIIPAVDYELRTNTTAFTIIATKPGIAVLHENWLADDFIATLNGGPVPYIRVNHTFKGVVIPEAGLHRIEFTYAPRGFNVSLIASAIGLGLIIAILLTTRYASSLDHTRATPLDSNA